MPFLGCVPDTIGYCCLTADVTYAYASAFLQKVTTENMTRIL